MKSLMTILLTMICLTTWSQGTLKIKIDNPSPRVGDQVNLSFKTEFLDDALKEQLSENIEFSSKHGFSMPSPNYSRVLEFNKVGDYTIGPFLFEFNGKQIISDSVKVKVDPKLPFEAGVWVRYINSDGRRYLIIEQLIENHSDLKTKKNGYSHTIGGVMDENSKFAKFKELSENGLEVHVRNSQTTTRRANSSDLFSPGLSYSFTKYEITIDESFKGNFELKKKHFTNLPKGTNIENIIIER